MEIKILGLDPGIAILGFGTIICHTSNQINLNADLVKLEDFGTIESWHDQASDGAEELPCAKLPNSCSP